MYRGSERWRVHPTVRMRASQAAKAAWPWLRARSCGVKPTKSARFMSAPRSRSSRAAPMWQFEHAAINGVIPPSVASSTWAPRSRSSRAVAVWPNTEAARRGVLPLLEPHARSAPRSSNSVAAAMWPFWLATNSGVAWSHSLTPWTSSPRSRQRLAASTRSCAHASNRGGPLGSIASNLPARLRRSIHASRTAALIEARSRRGGLVRAPGTRRRSDDESRPAAIGERVAATRCRRGCSRGSWVQRG
mmetsp:Transcript_20834/g.62322  ORF Transcript_20834/g.62322 Transcript_20834/m.62322 type:complete len:246 (+) Transcript_20834:361-1098(+)